MKKIDWKPIKDIAELVCGATAYVLVLAASSKVIVHIAKDSSMYSHDKVDMIKQLSQD